MSCDVSKGKPEEISCLNPTTHLFYTRRISFPPYEAPGDEPYASRAMRNEVMARLAVRIPNPLIRADEVEFERAATSEV